MAPHAAGVVREQVDRDRGLGRGRAHAVDVVGRRDQRVEVAGAERAALAQPQGAVLAGEDLLVLGPAVQADEAPGEVVVHRGLGPRRHDQAEQRQRAVPGAVAGATGRCRRPCRSRAPPPGRRRQPVRVGEQVGEAGADALDGVGGRAAARDRGAHIGDEGAHVGRVEDELVGGHGRDRTRIRRGGTPAPTAARTPTAGRPARPASPAPGRARRRGRSSARGPRRRPGSPG